MTDEQETHNCVACSFCLIILKEVMLMYVVLTYDVGAKRVAKVRKTCNKYLVWVQNSVFEGNITEAKLSRLKRELDKLLDINNDNIRIYRLDNIRFSSLEVIGSSINTDFII